MDKKKIKATGFINRFNCRIEWNKNKQNELFVKVTLTVELVVVHEVRVFENH